MVREDLERTQKKLDEEHQRKKMMESQLNLQEDKSSTQDAQTTGEQQGEKGELTSNLQGGTEVQPDERGGDGSDLKDGKAPSEQQSADSDEAGTGPVPQPEVRRIPSRLCVDRF